MALNACDVLLCTKQVHLENFYLGDHLVDKIRDAAAQKGTGKWAVIEAMNAGVPANMITESVSARFISALKDDRVTASTQLVGPNHQKFEGNLVTMVDDIRKVTQKLLNQMHHNIRDILNY